MKLLCESEHQSRDRQRPATVNCRCCLIGSAKCPTLPITIGYYAPELVHEPPALACAMKAVHPPSSKRFRSDGGNPRSQKRLMPRSHITNSKYCATSDPALSPRCIISLCPMRASSRVVSRQSVPRCLAAKCTAVPCRAAPDQSDPAQSPIVHTCHSPFSPFGLPGWEARAFFRCPDFIRRLRQSPATVTCVDAVLLRAISYSSANPDQPAESSARLLTCMNRTPSRRGPQKSRT
jgi:hypothetical protein